MILNLGKGHSVIWLKRRDLGPGTVYEVRELTATVEFSDLHSYYNCPLEELFEYGDCD